ncbi:MAG: Hpt domain-containing protein [Nitrospirae bacterium]|nr:Hpt domain-containing protein [Nitrospirota bacterium]
MAEDTGKIFITIETDLAGLIPGYLANRRKDIESMNAALDSGDFEAIRKTGHQLKGSGGGYGFDFISDTGKAIELAAKDNNPEEIIRHIAALGDYIDRLEIVYE